MAVYVCLSSRNLFISGKRFPFLVALLQWVTLVSMLTTCLVNFNRWPFCLLFSIISYYWNWMVFDIQGFKYRGRKCHEVLEWFVFRHFRVSVGDQFLLFQQFLMVEVIISAGKFCIWLSRKKYCKFCLSFVLFSWKSSF